MTPLQWGAALILVAVACSPAATASDAALDWCQRHEAEVLLADQVDDPAEAARLIRGAAIARMARRIEAESRFLYGYGAIDSVAEAPLQSMRQLEAYTENSEAQFVGFYEDEWMILKDDVGRHNQACSLAYSAHLEVGDR